MSKLVLPRKNVTIRVNLIHHYYIAVRTQIPTVKPKLLSKKVPLQLASQLAYIVLTVGFNHYRGCLFPHYINGITFLAMLYIYDIL